jgi:CheY-like chemotaxis protein
MLQLQHPKDPHRDRRGVLLIAGESPLRSLISTYLLTMRCGCLIVSTPQQLAGVRQETFDWVLIDMANSEMPAEQAIVILRELHPGLSERMVAFSSGATNPQMLELIERYGLRQMSQGTLLPQGSGTLHELVAASGQVKLLPRSVEVAELIFDSFRVGSPAGVRSSHGSGRQLAYRHKNKIVDLLITQVGFGRVLLAGQVLGGGMGMARNNCLVVLLIDGMTTVARTTTNQFGEFLLEFEIMEDPGLQIRVREGWTAIPLGKMDWAKNWLPD